MDVSMRFPVISTNFTVSNATQSAIGAVRLGLGMAVTAEVKMGRRRVIECVWSPLANTASAAGRER